MEWKELSQASPAELNRRLTAQREQLRDLRFRISQGTHKDMAEVGATKKVIAQILTRLTQLAKKPSA